MWIAEFVQQITKGSIFMVHSLHVQEDFEIL